MDVELKKEPKIYHFKLADIYGGVGPRPIQMMNGFSEVGCESEQSAILKLTMQGGRIHFLEGNKIFAYLSRNLAKHYDDIVTFVVPKLNKVYMDNVEMFGDEQKTIKEINKNNFRFYNVYNYAALSHYENVRNVNEFQLIGNITPYDVLHLRVPIFIALLNTNKFLDFYIHEDIIIRLDYTKNDFFDIEYQKDIRYINYTSYKDTAPYIDWKYVHSCKK
jgi:hypothetical protein